MCGIAGRFHPQQLPPDPQWADRATELLKHRGPDDKGYLSDEYCELVHRRLSIIDLSPTGHQPMPNEDGTVHIIYNGEIYNHMELREKVVASGHQLRGTSDTEVILHLYEDYGENVVEHITGMFTFAIYDQKKHRLVLARDRYGIKPLYYTIQNGVLVFASEIKGILAIQDGKFSINRQACYDYFGLCFMPEPHTAFQEIQALPKGHTLIYDGDVHVKKYYQMTLFPLPEEDLNTRAEKTADAILTAVKRQGIADVPVGALLSGGIDSSLVVAGLCKSGTQKPQSFNVKFPDAAYDETQYALSVSKQYGTQHTTIDFGNYELSPDLLTNLIRHFDQPFADTSLIPMYAVARGIRDSGIICAMSGDGGDEAFGGYSNFIRMNRFAQMMRIPKPALQGMGIVGRVLSGQTENFGRQLMKAAQFAKDGLSDVAVLFAGITNYLDEEQKATLVHPDARAGLLPVYRYYDQYEPQSVTDPAELSKLLTLNTFDFTLVGDMLRKVDMMSMYSSVEIRVPMLDDLVVEQGLSITHDQKTNGQKAKLVLREVAKDWLPEDVVTHRKQGFGIPLDVILGQEFHELFYDKLVYSDARIHSFMDKETVGSWVERFANFTPETAGGDISREGLYQRIVMALSTELWMEQNSLTW